MPDYGRVQRNLAKMKQQNAPEEDVTAYLSSEGTSMEDVQKSKEITPAEYFLPTAITKATPKFTEGKRNLLGDIFQRPGAAVRSGLMGKGYAAGAAEPEKVPYFADILMQQEHEKVADRAAKRGGILDPNHPVGRALVEMESFNKGVSGQVAGTALDIITNPADILTMMAANPALRAFSKTKGGQAIGRFFSKPRRFFKFGKRTVQDIAEKAHKGIKITWDKQSDMYDEGLKSIKGNSKNLQPIVDKIDDVINDYPEQPFTNLKKTKDRLMTKQSLTAEELHNLKQELKKGIPKSVFKGSSEADAIQGARLRVYDTVDDTLSELGGQKYVDMKAEYREFKNMVQDVNSAILERGRPGEQILRGTFMRPGGTLTYRQSQALKQLSGKLPSQYQFWHDFTAWQRAQLLKRLAAIGIGGGLLYGTRRRVGELVPDIVESDQSGGGGY